MNNQNIKKIAIIGSGIAGLTATYLLHKKYEISLFESDHRLGGHSNTVTVKTDEGDFLIDTGFIVFNYKTYPNFIKLLNTLNIETQLSNMSFSFSSNKLGFEYSGENLSGLICQKSNLFKRRFYQFLVDIYRFNKKAKNTLQQQQSLGTLSEFFQNTEYSSLFYEAYLNPLAAAIWSTPPKDVDNIPAKFIFEFYHKHGLLDLTNRPQWYTIKNGSQNYVNKIADLIRDRIHTNTEIKKITRQADSVILESAEESMRFDAVVIACHSDQALALLTNPSEAEHSILAAIPYFKNTAVLHTDENVLPQSKKAWASWNYKQFSEEQASLTYYMNKLQSLKSKKTFCVSINQEKIDPKKSIKTFHYAHPQFTQYSITAQSRFHEINGKNRTFYSGAYWFNGFHEDGVKASLRALSSLGVTL